MTSDPQVDRTALAARLEGWAALRVLVIGDVILDEYRVGEVERVSPEAPVPIVRVRSEGTALGGAANVARNLLSLGAKAELIGLVGRDNEAEVLRSAARELGLDPGGLVESEHRPTSHKLRVVARGQQMLRLDREEDRAIDVSEARALRRSIEDRIADCDGVILEDYDKGLFADGLGRFAIELARARGLPVMADPKTDLGRFRGATLVKPNQLEALRFDADRVGAGIGREPAPPESFEARRALLEKVQFVVGGGDVVMTRGRAGMTALEASGRAYDVPTGPLEVFDVQGAGDTSMAALTLSRLSGASLAEACIVANAAAAVVVEKVGTAAATQRELRARLPEAIAVGTARRDAASDASAIAPDTDSGKGIQ